ncbi:trypsin-like serine peptidase [uncultured Methylobacterium sp.]|uniref:trypsin-like serine peptidase n=1 Tax=uncultured Methylobacterium sp. TaxID=157278 RepID=UPI0035C94AEB
MRAVLLAGLGLLSAAAAGAEDIAFDADAWPYTAIGKLNVVLGANRLQACTATLIGPRLALTAAHCLWDVPRKRWVNPAQVHFVAGYRQGAYRAHTLATGYRKPPDYAYAYGTAQPNMQGDWALVALAQPIPVEPLALEDRAPDGDPLRREIRRAGYSRLRPQTMSTQGHCSAQLGPTRLLLHDCRAVPGESGSALLQVENDRPAVIGVLVASNPREDGAAPSIAVPTGAFRAVAQEMLREAGQGVEAAQSSQQHAPARRP